MTLIIKSQMCLRLIYKAMKKQGNGKYNVILYKSKSY